MSSAFQRVFTCKNRRRYSRERAPRSLGGIFNSIFTSLLNRYGRCLSPSTGILVCRHPNRWILRLGIRVRVGTRSYGRWTSSPVSCRVLFIQVGGWVGGWEKWVWGGIPVSQYHPAGRQYPSILRQTFEGSFSAVSKPIFASKHSFESSRRDLHITLLSTALQSHFL